MNDLLFPHLSKIFRSTGDWCLHPLSGCSDICVQRCTQSFILYWGEDMQYQTTNAVASSLVPEEMEVKCGIGIKTAKSTLKVTTRHQCTKKTDGKSIGRSRNKAPERAETNEVYSAPGIFPSAASRAMSVPTG